MIIYLIRHAQSEENALDLEALTTNTDYNAILQRSFGSALTPLGQEQARAVAEQFRERPIERLYSSPFQRALSTATVLGEALGLQPEIIEDLGEVMPPLTSSQRSDATLRRHFLRSYFKMLLPTGEQTWRAGYRRARSAWTQITAEPRGEVAVVSHFGLISLTLLSLRRSSHWRITARDTTNGGVSVVESR